MLKTILENSGLVQYTFEQMGRQYWCRERLWVVRYTDALFFNLHCHLPHSEKAQSSDECKHTTYIKSAFAKTKKKKKKTQIHFDDALLF